MFKLAAPTPEIREISNPPVVEAIIGGMDVSEGTRVQYRRDILVFLTWLGSKPVTPNVLLDFKRDMLKRQDIAAGTKAKYLAVARAFLRELYRRQILPIDVTTGIKGIKTSRLHKRAPISDNDAIKLAAFIGDVTQPLRDRVLMALLFYQGLRRVELERLRASDFQKDESALMVLGKGADDRMVVDLHPVVDGLISGYLNACSIAAGPMFPSPTVQGRSLTGNAIWRIAMRVHRQLGIKNRNVHAWRKAFTTRLIRSGMNLLEVQGYTRHASVEMLMIYYNKMEKDKTLPVFYSAFSF